MGIVTRYYGGAGRSGERRYKELVRDWKRRTLGRRTTFYVWAVLVLLATGLPLWTPAGWRYVEGALVGGLAVGFFLLPDALMPDYIARWQRGVWGEQSTAQELRRLSKRDWLVRHDLATGRGRSNRDHVAAGPAVYLLDSKMLKDEVWVNDQGLHVRRIGPVDDEYVDRHLTQRMSAAARAVKRELDAAVGFPVAVYSVVVIWGHFAQGAYWDTSSSRPDGEGAVAYVDGERIADWLAHRPMDLVDPTKRAAVKAWLKSLPRA